MICPYCQTELPENVRYCKECGGDVTRAQAPVHVQQQPIVSRTTNATQITPAEENARNIRIGVVVVVSIAAVTILCAIVALTLLA